MAQKSLVLWQPIAEANELGIIMYDTWQVLLPLSLFNLDSANRRQCDTDIYQIYLLYLIYFLPRCGLNDSTHNDIQLEYLKFT